MENRYVLGVKNSLAYNLDKGKNDYSIKITVGQEVYDWLNMHDVIINSDGKRIYKQNKIKYVDLGLEPITPLE